MNSNGVTDSHLRTVGIHAFADAFWYVVAFVVGILASPHITTAYSDRIVQAYPGLAVGVPTLLAGLYIFGFYHDSTQRQRRFVKFVMVMICVSLSVGAMVAVGYLHYESRVDRFPMLIGAGLMLVGICVHHLFLSYVIGARRQRLVMIVTCLADEIESANIRKLCEDRMEWLGIVTTPDYTCRTGGHTILGTTCDLHDIVESALVDRVACTQKGITSRNLYSVFNKLRYSGTGVQTILCLYEELHQCCPVALVTPEWLLNASGSPHMFYIRKIKRAFDIVTAVVGLVFLGPIMLVGMLGVKLTSRGPVFYRQRRCGRFGQPFEVIKLRSMTVDAEKSTGAIWSSGKSDVRVTPIGGFLRKYRVDEIPQLINVLRGEMSFVGPRPERPEFIARLEEEIPYYGERMLVQPGLTGWAQVNFPYGATVDDTRRKLEYDLFYMKNMSLVLDLVIIMDTIRIVLVGGLDSERGDPVPQYESVAANHVMPDEGDEIVAPRRDRPATVTQ